MTTALPLLVPGHRKRQRDPRRRRLVSRLVVRGTRSQWCGPSATRQSILGRMRSSTQDGTSTLRTSEFSPNHPSGSRRSLEPSDSPLDARLGIGHGAGPSWGGAQLPPRAGQLRSRPRHSRGCLANGFPQSTDLVLGREASRSRRSAAERRSRAGSVLPLRSTRSSQDGCAASHAPGARARVSAWIRHRPRSDLPLALRRVFGDR